MIEVLSTSRCTECDICVRVCPTNVFDAVAGEAPAIARQDDCQTCFMCEAYCPADAIFVSPLRTPAPPGSPWRDEAQLERDGQLGLYRSRVGWGGHAVVIDPQASAAVLQLMASRAGALIAPSGPATAAAPAAPADPSLRAPIPNH